MFYTLTTNNISLPQWDHVASSLIGFWGLELHIHSLIISEVSILPIQLKAKFISIDLYHNLLKLGPLMAMERQNMSQMMKNCIHSWMMGKRDGENRSTHPTAIGLITSCYVSSSYRGTWSACFSIRNIDFRNKEIISKAQLNTHKPKPQWLPTIWLQND